MVDDLYQLYLRLERPPGVSFPFNVYLGRRRERVRHGAARPAPLAQMVSAHRPGG